MKGFVKDARPLDAAWMAQGERSAAATVAQISNYIQMQNLLDYEISDF